MQTGYLDGWVQEPLMRSPDALTASIAPEQSDFDSRPDIAQDTPSCRSCHEPLSLDDVWGWVHLEGGYLCRDANTGEPLCQAATLL